MNVTVYFNCRNMNVFCAKFTFLVFISYCVRVYSYYPVQTLIAGHKISRAATEKTRKSNFVQYIICCIVQYKFKQPHELEEQYRVLSQEQTQLTDQHINKVRKARLYSINNMLHL